MNKIKKFLIIFVIIIILICNSVLLFFNTNYKKNDNDNDVQQEIIIENNDIVEEEKQNENNDIVEEKQPIEEEQTMAQEETYTTMYATVGLNIRKQPNKESDIIDVVSINTELTTVDNSNENDWIKIKMNDNYYYVASKYLSTSKVEIKENQNINVTNRNNTYRTKNNGEVLTKSKGVNYFNGHKETWYSQKVLPGGGLKIPGRHVDDRGLVCDENGYICVASSDYSKGTIVETSLGTGKVYDCGCASGTIDIYTNW